MKRKKQTQKNGRPKTLDITAAIPPVSLVPKRSSEQTTDAADKQGLEDGKAAAGKAVEETFSAARNILNKNFHTVKETDNTDVNPKVGRPQKGIQPQEAYPDSGFMTEGITEKVQPNSSAISHPLEHTLDFSHASFTSIPSTRDDGQLRVRETVHQNTVAEGRTETTRFVERGNPLREKGSREFQEPGKNPRGDDLFPTGNKNRQQFEHFSRHDIQEKPVTEIFPEDEKEIPVLPREEIYGTNYTCRDEVDPEKPFVPPQEDISGQSLSAGFLDEGEARAITAPIGRGMTQRTSLPEDRTISGKSRSQSRDIDNLRTRSTEHPLRTREGDSDPFSEEDQTVKTSGQEERFARYSKNATDTADTVEKTHEAAETTGEAAKTAGEAAEGASSAGAFIAIREAIQKSGDFVRAVSGNEKSPTGNDHSDMGSAFSFLFGGAAIFLSTLGVVLLPVMIAALVVLGFSFGGNTNLSEDVVAWMPQIHTACAKYHIPEYAPLAAAIMMQESGGNAELVHGDLMQCAEGMGLPAGTPVDPEASIDFGVSLIANLLHHAEVMAPADLDHLKLAVQAYNFGSGYISYALAQDGKYTKENAAAFALKQAADLSWDSYGDVDYVDHVFRYYTVSAGAGTGSASSRYPSLCYPMEGYSWTTYAGHEGIDIPCEIGTPVYASASGTVSYVKSGWTDTDGVSGMMSYGNCVGISHGDGLETRYAHLSYPLVSSGQQVLQGQIIGYSGNTGNSTGPHMHFAVYVNGSPGGSGYLNNAALAFPDHKQ